MCIVSKTIISSSQQSFQKDFQTIIVIKYKIFINYIDIYFIYFITLTFFLIDENNNNTQVTLLLLLLCACVSKCQNIYDVTKFAEKDCHQQIVESDHFVIMKYKPCIDCFFSY